MDVNKTNPFDDSYEERTSHDRNGYQSIVDSTEKITPETSANEELDNLSFLKVPPPYEPPPIPSSETSSVNGSSASSISSASSFEDSNKKSSSRKSKQKQKSKTRSKGKGNSAFQPTIVFYQLPEETVNINHNNSARYSTVPVMNTGARNNDPVPGLVPKLRVINIILSVVTILFEVPFVILKVFSFRKLILASYLSFMAILLLLYELQMDNVAAILKDNFGILYSPFGRSMFLILMGMLATGQSSLVEIILGICFVLNGVGTMFIKCRYPDFFRDDIGIKERESENKHSENDASDPYYGFQQQMDYAVDRVQQARSYASSYIWADPNRSFSEGTALLTNV